ncbi:MAG: glycosyltransferase, partial [Planctomycetota bacterium]|nr:glycosyltransferase [Planctomycetota bacterium]
AEKAKGEHLALLHHDMRIDRGWLLQLVEAAVAEPGIACVGGRIQTWDDKETEFGGGAINFEGRSLPGESTKGLVRTVKDGDEIFFPSGGSMLIRRELFLDVGGFDADYFSCGEDVDLGWRLWLYGHRIVFAQNSIAYRAHRATTRGFPEYKDKFLAQRNSLFTIIKNYGDGPLSTTVSASLLLAVQRAMPSAHIDRKDFRLEASSKSLDFDGGGDVFDRSGAAELVAVQAVTEALPRLLKSRLEIQRRRTVPDEEILGRFGDPLAPILGEATYREVQKEMVSLLGVRRSFGLEKEDQIVFASCSAFDDRLSGSATRFLEMARVLAREFRVKITTPYEVGERNGEGVEIVRIEDNEQLSNELAKAKVVVTSGAALEKYPALRSGAIPLVLDLYRPAVLESLEVYDREWGGQLYQRAAHAKGIGVFLRHLEVADYFLVASERGADFALGGLLASGRINPDTYAGDPTLSGLVGIVPDGIPEEPPSRRGRAIREACPKIAAEDKVLIWGGGKHPWMDPRIFIRAMDRVRQERKDCKLLLLGTGDPGRGSPGADWLKECTDLARELGVLGEAVFLQEAVPERDRANFFLDADIGVSAYPETLEARFSVQAQLLEYFSASLPIISAGTDRLTQEAEGAGAAVNVPSADPERLAEAILKLLGSPKRLKKMGKASGSLGLAYRWSKVVMPLAGFCRNSRFAADRGIAGAGRRRVGKDGDATAEGVLELIRSKGEEKRQLLEERRRILETVSALRQELNRASPLVDRVMNSLPFRIYDYIVRRRDGADGALIVPIRGTRAVKQAFRAVRHGLCGVAVEVATYKRQNTADLIFRLRSGRQQLREVKVSARDLTDNEEFVFRFDPV